jgi:hypothetical protein
VIREIQPAATTSTSAEGRWLDGYVAYTSWAMRVLASARRRDDPPLTAREDA